MKIFILCDETIWRLLPLNTNKLSLSKLASNDGFIRTEEQGSFTQKRNNLPCYLCPLWLEILRIFIIFIAKTILWTADRVSKMKKKKEEIQSLHYSMWLPPKYVFSCLFWFMLWMFLEWGSEERWGQMSLRLSLAWQMLTPPAWPHSSSPSNIQSLDSGAIKLILLSTCFTLLDINNHSAHWVEVKSSMWRLWR